MTDAQQERLRKAAVVIRRLKERLSALELERELERAAPRERVPVAIIGAGCRFPGGADDLEGYWALLDEGRDGVTSLEARWAAVGEPVPDDIPRWAGLLRGDPAAFDAAFFGVSPREAVTLDPQHRLLLEVTWEALEDAGVPASALAGSDTGVYVGACVSDYGALVARRLGDEQDAYAVTGNLLSVAAGRLAYTWGLQGPCVTLDTACSSSLTAIHLACRSLRARECALALAGGVNVLLSATMMGALGRTQALAPDGRCKTFDALANGYARGEGCGVVVLKRLDDARRDGDRVLAVIRGSAMNQDGRSTGLTAPNVRAQEELLRAALRDAELAPEDIDFVETHGTGTALGDPIEVDALRAVFPTRADGRPCTLGAVKTNLGHLEAAAGVAGVLKTALALRHERIPGNLHFRTLNPRVRLEGSALRLASAGVSWPRGARARRAGVSSFGMSGTNVHIVLEEAPTPAAPARADAPAIDTLVVLSARSDAALVDAAARLRARLDAPDEPRLEDVAFSLATTRSHLSRRLALTAATRDELREALAGLAALAPDAEPPPGVSRARSAATRPRVVFVFPGQGSQWRGMGRELLAREPVFREAFTRCDRAVQHEAGWSPIAALHDDEAAYLTRIDRVQPALFAVEVALATLWRAWGLEPDAVVGHSMGEVAAAHVAGALTLADAVAVICRRSQLLRRLSGAGEMALVELPLEEARRAVADHERRVSVAVSNSPNATVLSGDPDALAELLEALDARGVFTRRIKVDVASHSPQVDPLLPALRDALRELAPQPARLPMWSTVTGAPLRGAELDAGYWARNLREPVRFADVARALIEREHALFIEMSPHPILTTAVRELLRAHGSSGAALASTRREQPERGALLDALGAAWSLGHPVNWRAVLPAGRRVSLPTYAWQRERYWISTGARPRERAGGHPLLGPSQSLAIDPSTRLWERTLDATRLPWIADHRVLDIAVFPGAGYLEMMLAAGAEYLGDRVALRDVEFVEALVFADDAPARAQIVATAAGHGVARVHVASQGSGGAWIIHARGLAIVERNAPRPPPLELAALRRRLSDVTPAPAIYDALARVGLDYGPAFQGLVELRAGAGEALARVRLPETVERQGRYLVHPALLDACLHVMAASLTDGARPRLPVALSSLHVTQRPGQALWCHARFDQGADERGRARADVRVVDERGALVAELRGLVAQELTTAPVDTWLLEQTWTPRERPAATVARGRYLILGDGDGLGVALHDALARAGHTVAHAHGDGAAASGGRRVDDTRPEGVRALVADCFGARGPTAIVHLRSLDDPEPARVDADALPGALERGALSLLHTAQALLRDDDASPPRLWLVTRGAQRHGDAAAFTQAPQLGLARTIALEHPELRCAAVDLDPARPPDELSALLAELLADADEQELALHDGARLVTRVTRRPNAPGSAPRAPQIRADRAYLITGGLGGLGLSAAGWLASRGAGQLALVGRAGVTTSRQREAIDAMRRAGARVTVHRANVADRAALAGVRAELERDGLPLAGVIHAAGVLDDALLRDQSRARLQTVSDPKALGALHLHALTRDLELDFFVLYASGAGVLGAPGQANYAAANAALDGLARYRRRRGLPALSVDWGLFSETGLAADGDHRGARLRARGARSLSREDGLAALERLLASDRAQAIVVPLDARAWAELVPAVAQLPRFASLLGGHAPPAERLSRRLDRAAPGERATLIRDWLRDQIARVLRLPSARLDDDRPLTALGMDSLMGLELKHKLKRELDVDIPMTRLLRDMTVARLHALALASRPAAAEREAPPSDDRWTDIEL
ncbi:MAG: SDR family NAD(P)-dependent oxidoreductase [Myxococcales bacterium]|nr:SDR family NAD(P)-dependent oxidoreductase [Myxococcales bacterium]